MGKKLASTGVDAGNRFEVVLGGGGVRGYGHLGFLNAIEEAGFVVPVYTGVSVGSIVAAFYTNGYSPAEIAEIFQDEIFRFDPAKIARSIAPSHPSWPCRDIHCAGVDPSIIFSCFRRSHPQTLRSEWHMFSFCSRQTFCRAPYYAAITTALMWPASWGTPSP